MRFYLYPVLMFVASLARAEDFQTAVIVDAGTQVQANGGAIIQNYGTFSTATPSSSNVSVVVLRLGTLQVTGEYKTILQGPRAASNLVVGDTVQARTDGKWLYFVMPGTGKTIKAKVMRQERI